MYRTIVSFLLALLGVALLAGGVWLAALGGSWFYILLGAALLASGLCCCSGDDPAGLSLYGGTIAGDLAWSV